MSTFYDRFRECAERWPENIALEIQARDGLESYSYAQVRQMAESFAHWLIRHSGNGHRIAILADNHPRWVAAYLGIVAAGSTAVPLDIALHADQVEKLIKDSGTSLIVCDEKHFDLAEKATAAATQILLLKKPPRGAKTRAGNLDDIFAEGPGQFTPAPSAGDDLACLLYTSGTTADPKGVMLTHANIMGEVEAVFSWAKIGPDDAVLGVLPLFHVLSMMANILLPLVKGARVVYLETLNTHELLRALKERKITVFAVVPQFFYLIHERIFKEVEKGGAIARRGVRSLMAVTRFVRGFGVNPGKLWFGKIHQTFGGRMRYLVTGGSRFDPKIATDFYSLGIDVLQAYGLTETSGAAFANRPEKIVIGSVGPPLTGVEVRILEPQAQEGSEQAVGEVLIGGAIVMKGYWNRSDASAAALQDGWLHTGDVGYLDGDRNLFLTGRKKEVIILSNGKNVYPEEIEAHYLKSPYIKEICVMGLEGPGGAGSERLHAVIVPNFEVLRERKIVNAKEVIRFDVESLGAQIASTKRIGSYEIWQDDLPRTTTRKIKRFEIERRVRQKQGSGPSGEIDERSISADDSAWLERPDVQRAAGMIREASRTHPEVISPSDNLELDLGFDSMQRVELLAAMEQELGGDVEESRLAEIYTVRDLVEAVLAGASAGKRAVRPHFAGWQTVLRENPSDPEVIALALPHRVNESIWYLLTRLAAMFSCDRFHLKVSGLEKLPKNGPFLLCPNHQSFIDGVVMSSVLPWEIFRDIFFVGTSEIFGSGFMRVLARWMRIMVVDPDANLVPAMRAGAFGLRYGKVLVLYPEGERSIDGTPKIFKKGAAILSIHVQVPVVPVAIEGFYDAWPRGKKFFQKFAPLKIAFGDPIVPPSESEASELTYEKMTVELKARVVEMWESLRKG